MASTFNTYPDLLINGGRLARTEWPGASMAEAVAATVRRNSEAVILRAADQGCQVRGLAPGGLAA